MSAILQDRLATGFSAAFGRAPDLVARAPGRVNLIGEHTDYNDGFALPVAIGAETRIALRRRNDDEVHVAALDFGEEDRFVPAAKLAKSVDGGWRDYVRGVFAILARAGIQPPGAEMAIAGDIPRGTGLSSSASLEVALVTAILAALGRREDPRQVASWAQAAENDFVGVRCGNLDQLASAGSVASAALLIDCRTLALEPVPLPPGVAIMIVQSGVVRGLVDGEYNARRRECEEAARALGVSALRDASLAMLEAGHGTMSASAFRRARHVITENARTLAAAEALSAGDLRAMGRLMAESHASQRDDFGITVAETDRLTELLTRAIGAEGGARQTGGGFGGAVVALMRRELVEAVQNRVTTRYRTPSGVSPEIRVEQAQPGASVVY